jgi:signal transduction histidine kinase
MDIDKCKYQILVVEDNPGDFALVEDFIYEQFDAPVIIQAKTFKEAKEAFTKAEHLYKVVLLDLSLPDHAGEPLIYDALELCGAIPVIVLTGYMDFAFGVKSLSLGISDYLLKDDLTAMSLYKSIVYSIERKAVISELETSEKHVRTFAKQLNDVLEEDRARIAREIHDEFGQQLAGLKMSLSALKKNIGVSKDVVPIIDGILTDINTSLQSLRHIANELRPVLIDKLGLYVAIEWLLDEFEKKSGINSRRNGDIDPPELTKMVEINIFRICQEALTNISKHANATLVNIQINHIDDRLCLKIKDNGEGIKPKTLHSPLSMGLLNMKERANLIGAELIISGSAKTGTLIELNVNINGKKYINSGRPFSN